ncbi:hypothetical protein [Phytohabitans suffuscus]|uniref:hypothetical protein n=1 Tax=Phytohabitans suffuscus TaxID=624315 RepID=UPI00156445D9|nr:hypothetical protein [Phytohabitans suffuscus]
MPTRKFCHRCGDSLVSAEVVRAPWWRRLLPRRRPNTVQSGLRPGEQPVGAPRAGRSGSGWSAPHGS